MKKTFLTLALLAGFCSNVVQAQTPNTLQFDGVDDYVSAPAVTAFNSIGKNDFTMEARIKVSSDNTQLYPIIMSNRTGHATGVVVFIHTGTEPWASGKLWVNIEGTNYPSSACPDLRDNQCHHVAVVRENGTLKFYLDGVLNNARPILEEGDDISSTGEFRIGHDVPYPVGSMNFKGEIGEVRIWNVARTASEIDANKNTTFTGTSASLLSYWKLNEQTGQVAVNTTNAALNGVLGATNAVDNSDPVRVNSCVSIVKQEDIYGPTCANKNENVVFTLDASNRVNATYYNWWFNGYTQQISQNAAQPYSVTINTGQYFNPGQVCIGVTYNGAPWYKMFCKNINVCQSLRTAETADIEISTEGNVYPNPFTESFTVKVSEEMRSMKVINQLGIEVLSSELNGSSSVISTQQLAPGIYTMIIQYQDGHQESVKISKR